MIARHEQPTPGPAEQIATMFAALVPVIRTDRLLLRAPRLSDFQTCAEIACSERGRFVGGPMDREEAWNEFAKMSAGWLLHGHGGFTIEDPETFDTLGFVVLGLEPGDQEVELGFAVTEMAEGKGIATEAAIAVRDWAARELGLTGLVSYIDPDNVRSVAVATRLNAVRDTNAEAALEDAGTHVYRHPENGGQHV